MLRGYRWQLVALLLSAVLFVVSLALRSSEPTPIPPTITPAPATPPPPPITSSSRRPPSPMLSAAPVVALHRQNGAYREALVGRIQRLNPLFTQLNPVDRDITSLIFEGLTRTDSYGEPVPGAGRTLDYLVGWAGIRLLSAPGCALAGRHALHRRRRDVHHVAAALAGFPRRPGTRRVLAHRRNRAAWRLSDPLHGWRSRSATSSTACKSAFCRNTPCAARPPRKSPIIPST